MRADSADDAIRQAAAAFNAGRHGEALGLCETACAQWPDDPRLNHLFAAILFAKREVQRARKHIEASLRRAPRHAPAKLLAARIARAQRDFEAALRYLDSANTPEFRAEAARTWFDLGLVKQDLKDHASAAAAYRHALANKSDYAEAAVNLGIALQDSGDMDGAMAAYARAYRMRADTLGMIATALTSSPHGRLWLDRDELCRSLKLLAGD